MRRSSRPARFATSLWLTALLGALVTGVPQTHLHGVDEGAHDVASSADHHSHGTRLLEQDERVPSPLVALPAQSCREGAALGPADLRVLHTAPDPTLRPTGRAPPCAHPRAPPHLA